MSGPLPAVLPTIINGYLYSDYPLNKNQFGVYLQNVGPFQAYYPNNWEGTSCAANQTHIPGSITITSPNSPQTYTVQNVCLQNYNTTNIAGLRCTSTIQDPTSYTCS